MKILFVEPYERTLYSFRKELLDALILDGQEVILVTDALKKTKEEYNGRIQIINVKQSLKDKSVIKNTKLLLTYKKIIRKEKPDVILSFSIKPNLYCGFAAKKSFMVANITGLGSIFNEGSKLKKLANILYKKSFKNVDIVVFQNKDSSNYFNSNNLISNKFFVLPGSGVNTDKFIYKNNYRRNDVTNFLYASRAIKEKGFNLLLEAIPLVIKEEKNVHFNIISSEEEVLASEDARKTISDYPNHISVINRTDNMVDEYNNNDFVVAPSFYKEGMSNILLESLACQRPIITTNDNPGCMEVLRDNENGLGVKSNDLKSLVDAIIKATKIETSIIKKMGENGRALVEKDFSRSEVVNKYLSIIHSIQ